MRKNFVIASAAFLMILTAAGTGIAAATSDDGDANITGPQARQAISAALASTGDGRANSVERDSENGATWEVEVTKADGNTVDVRLDEKYRVVVVEGDHEPAAGG